jgi:polyhydroxyalkanoate synthesis regulator phasin
MPSEFEILLQSILAQTQSNQQKLDKVADNMVGRGDFQRFQDTLDDKFVEIKETLEEHDEKFIAQDKTNIAIETRVSSNSTFINNLGNGAKWLIRVVVVAGLGLVATMGGQFLSGNFNKQSSQPYEAPPAITSPAPQRTTNPW